MGVFANNCYKVTVYFDLEKVHDTILCHGILLNYSSLSPANINYLGVCVGGVLSDARLLQDGVPQESILIVILFAVAINNVFGVLPDGV